MINFKMKFLPKSAILTSLILLSTNAISAKPGDENNVDFALLSDTHVDVKNEYPININPNNSYKGKDLDRPSFITLASKLSSELPLLPENPSFLVLLGDLPSHNAGRGRDEALTTVFQTFYEKFYPMPLFYSFGNNDSIERNYGRFKHNGQSAYEISKSVTGGKGGFLTSGQRCPSANNPCLIGKNEKYGYYSAYIGDHLKLLSVNSVIFVSRPGFSPSREGDKEQIKWLVDEINKSQANNEQVVLSMHVGPNSWMPEYNSAFKKMITASPKTVVGLFAAHSHYDEMRAIKAGQSIIPIIFSAGLSTGHGNAASFKTISIGRSNSESPWEIKNYSTYYFKGYKADSSSIAKYYDFNTSLCSANQISVSSCIKNNIKKASSGKNYVFSDKASKILSVHKYANPKNPGDTYAKNWVLNY